MNKKTMNKKAMGIGQVFIFIVAAITFALIMIFGYKMITGFLESGEEVAFVQFKTDLETSVQKIYTEYGAVRIERFHAPQDYTKICFVDMDTDYDPEFCAEDQFGCTVWEGADEARNAGDDGWGSVDVNVFLTPPGPQIKVFKIGIDPVEGTGYLCIPLSGGSFPLVLEGKGDRTELSRLPPEEA
jgi:hypothetical protein